MTRERSTELPERVHAAVSAAMARGDNPWEVSVAACEAASAYLREEIAVWLANQAGRGWTSGDEAFRQAAEQCADTIDPEVWRYLGKAP